MAWDTPYPDAVFDLLGLKIHRLDRAQLLHCFREALESDGPPLHFGYANIAISNQAADLPEFSKILNDAELIYVDGAGIRLGCHLLGTTCPPRNTGADFFPSVLELCATEKKKVGFLGGSPHAAEQIRLQYTQRYPGLQIPFVRDGYAETENHSLLMEELRSTSLDLLIVGMGAPKQEHWVSKYRKELPVKLLWTVGALFEYDSGNNRRCPRWMRSYGMEWVHRFFLEPKRLWRRYLLGNPRFLLRCLSSRLRGRVATR